MQITIFKLLAFELPIYNILTMVHWTSTSAPNVINTSTRYGANGTPDNKFEKKKYISSRRKGLITSG